MKKSKKFFSLLLAVIMLFGITAGIDFTVQAAVMASSFSSRTNIPNSSDYWITKYNTSNNCTRYAYARISEILNTDATSILGTRPGADGFPNILSKAGYSSGSTPKPGSVMCTSGHVAIVESVNTSNGTLVVSEGHSFTDMSGNSRVSKVLVDGKSIVGYSTLTTGYGAKHGTWFDLRTITYTSTSAKYYYLVNSNTTPTPPTIQYASITQGEYYIQNANGKIMTTSYNSNSSGTIVNVWDFIAHNGYRVNVSNASSGYKLRFSNCDDNIVINAYADSPKDGTKVNIREYTNNSTQWWLFQHIGNGWYAIRNAYNPNVCLTLNADSNGYGAVTLQTYTGSTHQHWALKPYTTGIVSYNANGGTGAPASQSKHYGETLTLSNVYPTRSGYSFNGWSTSSTATVATYPAGGSYTSDSNATLYAVWKANTYQLTYNSNGGSGAPDSQTKTYGQSLTLSSQIPIREGYTFLGWSEYSNSTTAEYYPGDMYSDNKPLTLYAVWEQIKLDTPVAKYEINSDRTFTVSWNAVKGADKYQVYSSNDGGETYNLKAETSDLYIITNKAVFGKIYKYKVRAIDSSNSNITSDFSDVLNAVNDKYLPATIAKYNVNSDRTFTLSWSSITGADKYEIYSYNSSTGTYKYVKTTTALSHKTGKAAFGTAYKYKIRAVNSENNIKSGYCTVSAVNNKYLPAPSTKYAVNSDCTLTVSWGKVTGADKYEIYSYNASTGTYKYVKTTTELSHKTGKAAFGTTYKYKIRAVNSANNIKSGYCTLSIVNNKKLTAPTANIKVNTNGSFTISWSKVTGATKYEVYIYDSAKKQYRLSRTSTGTSITTGTASKGVTYYYKVRAVTSSNTSATSDFSAVVKGKR